MKSPKPTSEPTNYHGIYRYEGMVVFKVKNKAREIRDYLEDFHKTVNKAARNQKLQFAAEIWTKAENSPTPKKGREGSNRDKQ